MGKETKTNACRILDKAKISGNKKVEMLPMKDLLSITVISEDAAASSEWKSSFRPLCRKKQRCCKKGWCQERRLRMTIEIYLFLHFLKIPGFSGWNKTILLPWIKPFFHKGPRAKREVFQVHSKFYNTGSRSVLQRKNALYVPTALGKRLCILGIKTILQKMTKRFERQWGSIWKSVVTIHQIEHG